jgi:hypothetical protein
VTNTTLILSQIHVPPVLTDVKLVTTLKLASLVYQD